MAELSVPQVDFRGLGDLADVYREGQMRAARQRTLADLGAGNGPLNYDEAARRLLSIGDQQGAITLANLGRAVEERQYQHSRDTREDQFRRDEAQRAQTNNDRSFGQSQTNADRSYALQVRQATEKPTYQVVEDAAGNKRVLQIQPYGAGISDVTPSALGGGSGQNPFAYGKQNDKQSQDSGYANRMFSAEQVLRDPKVETAATSPMQNMKSHAPGFLANYATNADFQKFDQARRNFVNAVLRRESGAAISQSEFDNAEKQYFPQPGDTPEKLLQKRQNRQSAIAGVAGSGGPAYRPPFTFDQAGNLVPSGNAGQGVRPTQQAADLDVQGSITNARAALAAGKSPDAIKQILRQNGIDPAMLDQAPQQPAVPQASPISDRLDLSQGYPTMEQDGGGAPGWVNDLAGRLARTRRQNEGPAASIGIRG